MERPLEPLNHVATMPNRVHRRDRRKAAPSTRGGQVNAISTLRILNALEASKVELKLAIPNPEGAAPGFFDETPRNSTVLNPDDFEVYQGATVIGVGYVSVSTTGRVDVFLNTPRTLVGTIVIKPFIDGLRGKTGSVNGGGTLPLPVPSGPPPT